MISDGYVAQCGEELAYPTLVRLQGQIKNRTKNICLDNNTWPRHHWELEFTNYPIWKKGWPKKVARLRLILSIDYYWYTLYSHFSRNILWTTSLNRKKSVNQPINMTLKRYIRVTKRVTMMLGIHLLYTVQMTQLNLENIVI